MKKFKEYVKDKVFLKYLLYSFYIVITTCLLFTLLSSPYIRNFFTSIENKTFDARQSVLAPYKKVSKNIVILAVDDESYEYFLDKYGEWPISRSIYADMVTYLENQGVGVTAFDLMFVKSLKSSNNDDNKLARTITKNDNVFTSINFDNQSFDLRKPADLPADLKADIKNESNINLKNGYTKYTNCRTIISQILNFTPNIGHINLVRDEDGIARDLHPFVVYKDSFYPHLALKVVLKYLEQKENLKVKDFKIDMHNPIIEAVSRKEYVCGKDMLENWELLLLSYYQIYAHINYYKNRNIEDLMENHYYTYSEEEKKRNICTTFYKP